LQGVDAGLALFHGSDLTTFFTQGLFKHHADIFFVVDDERAHQCTWLGKAMKKALPWPGVDSAHTRPPCFSISFTMALTPVLRIR
jgi:hypothetical protein